MIHFDYCLYSIFCYFEAIRLLLDQPIDFSRVLREIIILFILLFVGLFRVFFHPGAIQASTVEPSTFKAPTEKIENLLLDQFTTEGTADYIVKFTQQATLSTAYQMNWTDRGWFVYNTLTEIAQISQVNSKASLDSIGLRYQTFIAGNELYVWGGNLESAQML